MERGHRLPAPPRPARGAPRRAGRGGGRPPPGGEGPRPPGAAPYGLLASNANFVPGKTVAQRSANYRRLYRAGIRAIRLDVSWVQVEPVGKPLHDYDFRERDHEVAAITRAGLRVIPILAYGHPDYSSRGAFVGGTPLGGGIPPFYVANAQYFPPDNPADFARYARTVGHHYRKQATRFENCNVQNEDWRVGPHRAEPLLDDHVQF